MAAILVRLPDPRRDEPLCRRRARRRKRPPVPRLEAARRLRARLGAGRRRARCGLRRRFALAEAARPGIRPAARDLRRDSENPRPRRETPRIRNPEIPASRILRFPESRREFSRAASPPPGSRVTRGLRPLREQPTARAANPARGGVSTPPRRLGFYQSNP